MIGRKEDPQGIHEVVFIPLTYDHEGDVWVSLNVGDGGFVNAIDAGITCVVQIRHWYHSIAAQSRLLRVLSEHPEFAFSGDSIDSEMIRDAARKLFITIAQARDDVVRLLDEPGEDDRIRIGDVFYTMNEESCMLEPEDGLTDEARGDSADLLFLRSVSNGLRRAYQATNRPVTAQGIEDVISFLSRLRDDRDPVNGNGENGGEETGEGGKKDGTT